MTTFDVYVEADYLDAAERTSKRRYLLRTQFDDTANAGEGNMTDVMTDAADLITALNVLSMAAIPAYRVQVEAAGSGTPNVASNNQVVAFTRIKDTDEVKSSFEVPAWDDVVFDENSENVLSAAYDTAAAAAALLLRAPETGTNYALTPDYSQSRTHKSRNIING